MCSDIGSAVRLLFPVQSWTYDRPSHSRRSILRLCCLHSRHGLDYSRRLARTPERSVFVPYVICSYMNTLAIMEVTVVETASSVSDSRLIHTHVMQRCSCLTKLGGVFALSRRRVQVGSNGQVPRRLSHAINSSCRTLVAQFTRLLPSQPGIIALSW